ncbi:glycosyltransferase [Kineococcus sp. T13]|uniref:glycosyltransferase n=1 Tax=Kineococcus vitellinus TaxID=2696565 RepID=UPI001411E0EB|nr:glycosyltransferase [Kineococcus vitellinus]
MPPLRPSPTVAAVIPAKDEEERIAATVAAVRSLAVVDLVVVVDDGSRDGTARAARAAGAVVVAHPRNRGKAAALQTGARAGAAAEARSPRPGLRPRPLLLVDADLGASAVETAPLTGPVLAGEADMTIAVLPPQSSPGGGRGLVVGLARRGTLATAGWSPQQPLSGMRCLTRAAFEAALPLAPGWGVETALTIDLLRAGHRVREVPCALQHRVTGTDWRSQLHRAAQYRDVARALARRRLGDALRRASGA